MQGILKVFLLEFPVCLLLAKKGNYLFSFGLYLAISLVTVALQRNKPKIDLQIKYPVISLPVTFVCSALFYLQWRGSRRVDGLAELLHMHSKQVFLLIAALLSMFAVFGIDYFIKVIFLTAAGTNERKEYRFDEYVFVFLNAFLMITLNSKCSPLYPFNNWDDANTIFTVGKSIVKGLVPYKDLFEQKGPFILFLQVPGSLISYTDFRGIWIIEIFFSFLFLLMSYKISHLYIGKKALILVPLISFVVYNSRAFCQGASAEEYGLGLIAYALYVGCKTMKNNELPSDWEFFWVGLTAACVFWMKYSMIGFYPAWYLIIFFLAVRLKAYTKLLRGTGMIILGVAVLSGLIFLYFFVNSALGSLIKCYFFNNIFAYARRDLGLLEKLTREISSIKLNNPVIFLAIYLIIRYSDKKSFLLVFFTFIGLFFTVSISGHIYQYITLILSIFLILGFCCPIDRLLRSSLFIGKDVQKIDLTSAAVSLFLAGILMCVFSTNIDFMKYEKEELMQYQMKAALEDKGLDSPTILTWDYGSDGTMTVMGSIPRILYFCWYNNWGNPEIKEAREQYLSEQSADVIVIQGNKKSEYPEFRNYTHEGAVWGIGVTGEYVYYHYYLPTQ